MTEVDKVVVEYFKSENMAYINIANGNTKLLI